MPPGGVKAFVVTGVGGVLVWGGGKEVEWGAGMGGNGNKMLGKSSQTSCKVSVGSGQPQGSGDRDTTSTLLSCHERGASCRG